MRKFYLSIITGLLFVSTVSGQVAVTNPTSTTPNLAATYTSLANAITALSGITAISGPVTITLNAGNPEIAPAGGYVIQFAATTTAANNIIIEGSANTITAFTPQTVGNLNDGIFKLVGADHITIQNFIMQENAANTINATSATNNMTEWGVALLRASLTNGAQNNTIQNNTISLNIAYRNTFGIYSNARHSSTAPTSATDATALSGSNLGNKVYANTISNVMMGITFIGTATTAFQDAGNDIGGNSVATGNTITNWGGNIQLSSYASNSGISYCIYMNHQVSDNVSYNTINSGTVGAGVSATFAGIRKDYSAAAPSGTFTSTISNNTITLSSAFTGGTLECIRTLSMNLSTATMTISNNMLLNNAVTAAGSTSPFVGIINSSPCGILNLTNNTIRGFSSVSTTGGFTGFQNIGAVVTTININNNKVGDAVAGAATFSNATTGGINPVQNTNAASTATLNMNFNSIDGFSVVTTGQLTLVYNTSNPANVNINNNLLGSTTGSLITFSGAQTNTFFGLYSAGGAATGTAFIQNNDITGITFVPTATCGLALMTHSATMLNQTFSNNTFTNLNLKSTGQISLINRAGSMAAGQTWTCTNNSIVGTFTKSAAGGTLLCMLGTGSSVNGSTEIETGNDFSNITVNGSSLLHCWYNLDGASSSSGPTKTITGNTFSNITGAAGSVYGIYMDKAAATTCSGNILSNFTGNGLIFGIYLGTTSSQGTHSISSNTISSFVSNGTGGDVAGILGGSLFVPVMNINGNTVTGLSTTKANGNIAGIEIDNAVGAYVYDNLVNNISGSGTGTPLINGIAVFSGTSVDINGNRIHTLTQTGAVSTASPVINGMLITAGTTVTAYNNFIANLTAPNANLADAVRGISVNSATASTATNLYYNSIYLNASSAGTNFGTSGIYHLTNATATTGALTMINNITVNTSTANGTGVTAAYRRSDATLNNFAATSDYNLLYAGIPSASRVIFFDGTNSDQTMVGYKTRVSTREANSISLMPTFVSSTDLHLTAANCRIDGRGTPIPAVSFDIDLESRNATYPDIGADEFITTGSSTLPVTSGCEDRIVRPVTGTIYTNNDCNPIARVVPSGADPVAGNVNACVTIDATQQYFNGEPYVQRHFDIEPVTSNQTTTSATITLYITNQEFVDYNTNNPVWPQMPTSVSGNADPNRFNVKVTQFHGAATTSPSSPGNYPGVRVLILPTNVFWNGSYWEVTFSVMGFSGFYVHSNSWNAPLPVSVNFFTGIKQGSSHLLNWKVTCNSTPRVTMELERSAGSGNFNAINSITADAARCSQPFNYTDAVPLAGMNYYRLKMTDAAGKVSYSSIVALLNAVKGFEMVSIVPNPVTGNELKLNIASATASVMQVMISDMQGRVVNRQSIPVVAGFNNIPMHVAGLPSGTYTITAAIAGEQARPLRFVKQ